MTAQCATIPLTSCVKKRLLPKTFKDENHIDEVKGVYVPFWLFDADADADIRYKATRVRSFSDSNYYYTETSFYSVTRGGEHRRKNRENRVFGHTAKH